MLLAFLLLYPCALPAAASTLPSVQNERKSWKVPQGVVDFFDDLWNDTLDFFQEKVGPFFTKDRRIKKKGEPYIRKNDRLSTPAPDTSLVAAPSLTSSSASSMRRAYRHPVLKNPGHVPPPKVIVNYTIPSPRELFLFNGKEKRTVGPYVNTVNPDAPARKARRMIIAGNGNDIRAFSPFGAPYSKGRAYAEVVNAYKEAFPSVRVYCMPIPTAGEFYLPDAASTWSSSQGDMIDVIFAALRRDVTAVDAYDALASHVREPIYSRTDHHWMPLGAYYAAESFAVMARVPFRSLDSYDTHVIHDFTGTMSGYTRDKKVQSTREEFVYYTPRGLDSKTIYTVYHLDRKRRNVISEDPPEEGDFFMHYPDGSAAAYSTFAGGDVRIVEIHTGARTSGRRLMILKDSFGNAVPSFLFYSFEEIHVIDCRYFLENMEEYVSTHGITDILFVNNMSHVCTDATVNSYYKYLTQTKK